jgi:hypothetical protein
MKFKGVTYTRPVLSLLVYLGALLLALIAINVLLVRTIRAEKQREHEAQRRKSPR